MSQETGAHYNVTVERREDTDATQIEATLFRNQNILRAWVSLPDKTGWILEVCARDKMDAFDKVTDMLSLPVTAMSTRTMRSARDDLPVPA